MQHALLVRRGKARAQLPRDLNRLLFGKVADAPEQRGEILAVDVLHRQEVAPVDVADVVDAADVRMRDLPGDLDLVRGSAPAAPRPVSTSRGRNFERDALAQFQVICPIDFSHPAAPDQPVDPVPARNHRPGEEASLVERRRRRPSRARRAGTTCASDRRIPASARFRTSRSTGFRRALAPSTSRIRSAKVLPSLK